MRLRSWADRFNHGAGEIRREIWQRNSAPAGDRDDGGVIPPVVQTQFFDRNDQAGRPCARPRPTLESVGSQRVKVTATLRDDPPLPTADTVA
jgi:hypothetical protein